MLLQDISPHTLKTKQDIESLSTHSFQLQHLEIDFSLTTIKRIMDNRIFTLNRIVTRDGYLIFSGKYLHRNTYLDIAFKCFYYPYIGTKFYFVPDEFFIFSNQIIFPYSIFTNIFIPQEKYWETLSSSFLTFDPIHLFLRQLPFSIFIPNSNNIELQVTENDMKLLFKENWDDESTGRLNIQFLREIKSRLAHTEIEEKLFNNDFKAAKEALEKVYQHDRENLYALERLMFINLTTSDLRETISLAHRVLEKNRQSTKALNALGLAYLQTGDREKANGYLHKLKLIFENSGNNIFTEDINKFLTSLNNNTPNEVSNNDSHKYYSVLQNLIISGRLEAFLEEFKNNHKNFKKRLLKKIEQQFFKKISPADFKILLRKNAKLFFTCFSPSRMFLKKIIAACTTTNDYEIVYPYCHRLRDTLKAEKRFRDLYKLLMMEHSFIQEDRKERAHIEYELARLSFFILDRRNLGLVYLKKACGLNKEYVHTIEEFKLSARENQEILLTLSLINLELEYESKNSLKSSLLLEQAALYLANPRDIQKSLMLIRKALVLEQNNYFTAENIIEKCPHEEAKKLFYEMKDIYNEGEAIQIQTYFEDAYKKGQAQQQSEALILLNRLLSMDNNHIPALFYKAELLDKNDTKEARKIFQKLYALQSKKNYFLSRDELLFKIDSEKNITKREDKT